MAYSQGLWPTLLLSWSSLRSLTGGSTQSLHVAWGSNSTEAGFGCGPSQQEHPLIPMEAAELLMTSPWKFWMWLLSHFTGQADTRDIPGWRGVELNSTRRTAYLHRKGRNWLRLSWQLCQHAVFFLIYSHLVLIIFKHWLCQVRKWALISSF